MAGALPKAKAATPGAKTAAARAGKGQASLPRCSQKSRAVPLGVAAALKRRSRPVEALVPPYPHTRARTGDPPSKIETPSPSVYSAVDFPPLSPGGQYCIDST